MNAFKGITSVYTAALARLASNRDAWGTAVGLQVFRTLDSVLLKLGESTLVVLDYAGISRTDVSFQREAVVETLRKHRPRLLFVATNIDDDDIQANLQAALEGQGQRLLSRRGSQLPQVIGRPLADEHAQTLRMVQEHPGFTSAQLTAPPIGLESSTASARLTALWKAGLLGRTQGAARSGGREYRYFPIA